MAGAFKRSPNTIHCTSLTQECCLYDAVAVEREFRRYLAMCARTFDVPTVIAKLGDKYISWTDDENSQIGRSFANFYSYAVQLDGPDVMVVLDADDDDRFRGLTNQAHEHDNGASEARVVFFAGAALRLEGEKVGALCLIGDKPRPFSLTDQQNLMDIAEILNQVISSQHSKYLRGQQQYYCQATQQCLSLVHNLCTPCTTLHLSAQSLADNFGLGGDYLESRNGNEESLLSSLLQDSDDLMEAVKCHTDLCKLMPPMQMGALSAENGKLAEYLDTKYLCEIPEVLDKLEQIFHQRTKFMTTGGTGTSSADAVLQNRENIFMSHPLMLASTSMQLLGLFEALGASCDNIDQKFSFHEKLKTTDKEADHLIGVIEVCVTATVMTAPQDCVGSVQAWTTESNKLLSAVGGLCSYELVPNGDMKGANMQSTGVSLECSFALPAWIKANRRVSRHLGEVPKKSNAKDEASTLLHRSRSKLQWIKNKFYRGKNIFQKAYWMNQSKVLPVG